MTYAAVFALAVLSTVLAVAWWTERQETSRLRHDLADARAEVHICQEWYAAACDQVADAERRLDRLQRAVDGAGVLVVPGHALDTAGAPHKLFLN